MSPAGKMAAPMTEVFLENWRGEIRGGLVAAPVGELLDRRLQFFRVGHPVPTQESVNAGQRALELARDKGPSGVLVLLLSDSHLCRSRVGMTRSLRASGGCLGVERR